MPDCFFAGTSNFLEAPLVAWQKSNYFFSHKQHYMTHFSVLYHHETLQTSVQTSSSCIQTAGCWVHKRFGAQFNYDSRGAFWQESSNHQARISSTCTANVGWKLKMRTVFSSCGASFWWQKCVRFVLFHTCEQKPKLEGFVVFTLL